MRGFILKLVATVDGVEAAIKVLEDREITNAGFGSNLAIDGTVECDATIVDHFGRSGACGATPNIKNPISLAKMILLESHKALTLRRVPPNLLIGEGAKDFASTHGMPLVPNDWLVSRNAFDRANAAFLTSDPLHKGRDTRDHTNAITTGTWNEGQPDSPAPGTPIDNKHIARTTSPLKALPSVLQTPTSPRGTAKVATDRSPLSFLGSLTSPKTPTSGSADTGSSVSKKQRHKRAPSKDGKDELDTGDRPSSLHSLTPDPDIPQIAAEGFEYEEDEDNITDTVGAIAIDQWGNMAAGSSSGGIGMKHRGRIGPAALVGIGTALIPRSEMTSLPTTDHSARNKDKSSGTDPSDWRAVAVVTSGTGEHMLTSQASQKCAERLYHETKRGPDGDDVAEEIETVIMESFIVEDFQKHPGVLRTPSASAIGAMAVRQTARGYYLFFGHNTDSFALASMSGNDRHPHCVMSRLNNESGAGVAQGSRKIAPS
ncbi:SWI5-dependent HO expression protein 4 [Pestalotiopsis sp. IQ-011]